MGGMVVIVSGEICWCFVRVQQRLVRRGPLCLLLFQCSDVAGPTT